MNNSKKKRTKIIATGLFVAALLSAGGLYLRHEHVQSSSSSVAASQKTVSSIDIDNGDEDIDWDSLPTTNVTLSSKTLTITTAGTYVLSGSTTVGVIVNTDGNVRLVLNGATIKSTTGPAIYVQSANNTIIQLQDGTTNTVADSSNHTDAMLDGAIYSADDLILQGSGTLNVTANYADAIVSKDDLKISSGTYVIKSVDDGIRGKDSVNIVGGTITIDAEGDGIKATNDAEADKGWVYIHGGTITVAAGDDGIHAEEKLVIDDGTVTITSSREGIEGANITINGGKITVTASDDGINASASSFMSAVITINGGTINVTVGSGDTDAIDSNGDVYINGGTINLTAPTSSIDYDDTAELNGGTVTVNGTVITEIPEEQMGGGGMMRR